MATNFKVSLYRRKILYNVILSSLYIMTVYIYIYTINIQEYITVNFFSQQNAGKIVYAQSGSTNQWADGRGAHFQRMNFILLS